jgi:alpha-L-fucosidase
VQLREKIPVREYARLKDTFTADRFDPDFITDLALKAGMKYITMTARHHDSFCLFKTGATDFNSLDAPARRDLIGEMTEACRSKGLGFFAYYSYALDWKHPYFYSREAGLKNARPAYEEPEPSYLWNEDKDFERYIDFTHTQLRELLTQYKPLAGIWLDPIMGYYARPDLFPIEETYALIRSLQPQVLISFKQGATGDEDFTAPERTPRAHPRGGEQGRIAWKKNEGKPIEICDTLQPRAWGYHQGMDGKHKTPEDVMEMLAHATKVGANLLLNTGPLPDGSIHPEDIATLTEVGRRLKSED